MQDKVVLIRNIYIKQINLMKGENNLAKKFIIYATGN